MKHCKSTNCRARANRFRSGHLPEYMIAAEQCVRARSDHSCRTLRQEKWNGREPTERSADEGGSTDQDRQRMDRRAQSSADTRSPQGAAPSLASPFAETLRKARERICRPGKVMASSVGPQPRQRREAPPASRLYL